MPSIIMLAMRIAVIQLVGDGLQLEATDVHPAGLLYSGGYDSKRAILYAASVMGHPRGVSLAGGDPDSEFVSGLRVMKVESGDVYWATDSMSLPRGLTEKEAKEVQAALDKHFSQHVCRVEKLGDIRV